MHAANRPPLPYKSPAAALLLSVLLGPLGLLYASFWGALILLPFFIFMAINHFYFLVFFIWVMACILSVQAVDRYNRQILKAVLSC